MDADATSSDYDVDPECVGCKVHSGFYHALNSVWGELYQEVTLLQALHPEFALQVTGHSMGAALAQLAGARFSAKGIDTFMINFGQPRIGNEAYANYSNEKFLA